MKVKSVLVKLVVFSIPAISLFTENQFIEGFCFGSFAAFSFMSILGVFVLSDNDVMDVDKPSVFKTIYIFATIFAAAANGGFWVVMAFVLGISVIMLKVRAKEIKEGLK